MTESGKVDENTVLVYIHVGHRDYIYYVCKMEPL